VEVARLHRTLGATSLYVTHDQVEAMTLADRIVLMKDGLVQQVGAPLDLYRRPANQFVGGFIGSPGMNLIPGRVEANRVVGDGFTAALPAGVAVEAGQQVVLGARPEDVRLVASDAEGAMGAQVEVVEPMGRETFVHCRRGEVRLVAQAPGTTLYERGATVHLSFDPAQMHLFDAKTEARL
jgi:multiple sugar transport system ATP-binding protein